MNVSSNTKSLIQTKPRFANGLFPAAIFAALFLFANSAFGLKTGDGADDVPTSIPVYDDAAAYIEDIGGTDTIRNITIGDLILPAFRVREFHRTYTLTNSNLVKNYADAAAYKVDANRTDYLYATFGTDSITPFLVTQLQAVGSNGDGVTDAGLADGSIQPEIVQFSTTAYGDGAKAVAYDATAVGQGAKVFGDQSTAIGQFALAQESNSIALGDHAHTYGERSLALGRFAHTAGGRTVAVGGQSSASGAHSTSLGYYATAFGERNTVLGYAALASNNRNALDSDGVVIPGDDVGTLVECAYVSSAVVGSESFVSDCDGVITGAEKSDSRFNLTDPSAFSELRGEIQTRLRGVVTDLSVSRATAVGSYARAIGNDATALGVDTIAGANAIALGAEATASASAIAIGAGTTATDNQIVIGDSDHTSVSIAGQTFTKERLTELRTANLGGGTSSGTPDDNSITTVKLADSAVTTAKLSASSGTSGQVLKLDAAGDLEWANEDNSAAIVTRLLANDDFSTAVAASATGVTSSRIDDITMDDRAEATVGTGIMDSIAIGRGAEVLVSPGQQAQNVAGATAVGIGASARNGDTAIGAGATVAADFSVAVGRSTVITENGEKAVAVGAFAEATGENAIAIGGGDSATNRVTAAANQIRVGTNQRDVRVGAYNLADITANTGKNTAQDAAITANRAGVATAVAIAGLPNGNGKSGLSLSLGNFESETAFAMGANFVFDRLTVKLAGASASSETSVSAGVFLAW